MEIIILFIMIFFHIIGDFHLQGCLANLKQKSWWETNYPEKLYKYDYVISLLMHSFEWTFIIMLPPSIYNLLNDRFNIIIYIILFILNLLYHAMVDDMKANQKKITLCQDQCIHLFQISLTFSVMI